MDFKDMTVLYFERTNAMQTFWNFQITVGFALIVFFGSAGPGNSRGKILAGICSVMFAAFAYVNLGALIDVTRTRLAVRDLLLKSAQEAEVTPDCTSAIVKTLNPPTVSQVIGVHLAGDIFALIGMWFLVCHKG